MPQHVKDMETHLALLANVTQTILKENEKLKQQHVLPQNHQKATEKEVESLKKEMFELKLTPWGYFQ